MDKGRIDAVSVVDTNIKLGHGVYVVECSYTTYDGRQVTTRSDRRFSEFYDLRKLLSTVHFAFFPDRHILGFPLNGADAATIRSRRPALNVYIRHLAETIPENVHLRRFLGIEVAPQSLFDIGAMMLDPGSTGKQIDNYVAQASVQSAPGQHNSTFSDGGGDGGFGVGYSGGRVGTGIGGGGGGEQTQPGFKNNSGPQMPAAPQGPPVLDLGAMMRNPGGISKMIQNIAAQSSAQQLHVPPQLDMQRGAYQVSKYYAG
jgi:hypothetical protein